MKRILFVCTGNICRSPMAELVMKDKICKRGLDAEFFVASAATSSDEIGNPVYPPVRKRLESRGISCAGKTAVQLRRSDYEQYDYIVGMDSQNLRNMLRIFGGDPQNKVSLLLDFTAQPHEIDDPWYTRDFATAEREICEGCEALLQHILEG